MLPSVLYALEVVRGKPTFSKDGADREVGSSALYPPQKVRVRQQAFNKGHSISMASIAPDTTAPAKSLNSDRFEQALAVGAIVLLTAALIAIGKGRDEWDQIPTNVWAHLLTIVVALAFTPIMLLRKRGDRLHRQLGWIWVSAMFLTALFTLDIHLINRGGFSFIHILSVWTMIQVPVIIWNAKKHRVAKHRSAVRGMVFGALLLAGFFTFPFDRLMGNWLFS
jgi:uncharacterized membrane protein